MIGTSKWAVDRAFDLANQHGHVKGLACGAIDAFAAYIQAHEEAPVEPAEALFRKIISTAGHEGSTEFSLDRSDREAIEILRAALAKVPTHQSGQPS